MVSASCITLGSEGIMTEMDAKSTGILWSNSWIRHRGTHVGLLRSPLFKGEPGTEAPQEVKATDSSKAKTQPTQQEIIGGVESPFESVSYPLPWFIGESKLTLWREFN